MAYTSYVCGEVIPADDAGIEGLLEALDKQGFHIIREGGWQLLVDAAGYLTGLEIVDDRLVGEQDWCRYYGFDTLIDALVKVSKAGLIKDAWLYREGEESGDVEEYEFRDGQWYTRVQIECKVPLEIADRGIIGAIQAAARDVIANWDDWPA